MTDADRLKIAMSLLNEISHYGLTSVVQGALRVQAAQVFAEYKATRPLKPLASEPTESVSALINATVQMNAAMDVARGVDRAPVTCGFNTCEGNCGFATCENPTRNVRRPNPGDCDATNGTDAREGKMLR